MTIERLGREGDGIAGGLRLPFALPGERWACGAGEPTLLDARADAGGAALSALRHLRRLRAAACRGRVAGRLEGGTIARALAARGLEAEIRPTLTSPPRSRRRATSSPGAAPGSRRSSASTARKSETLVEVPGCLVVTPAIAAALPALARLTAGRGEPDRHARG